MVICGINRYKLGGSGIPWRDCVERLMWQPSYTGQDWQLFLPKGNSCTPVLVLSGMGFWYNCLVFTSQKPLPGLVGYLAPHQRAEPRQQNTDG